MLKIIITLLVATSFVGCTDNDDDLRKNGFTVDGEFYETPFGGYFSLGAPGENNFDFIFMDKNLWLNESGELEWGEFKNTTVNSFQISDLILPEVNSWEGEYNYNKTQYKPQCVYNLGYGAKLQYDSDGEAINPPSRFPDIHSGVVKILSREGDNFEIEYEALFNEGNRHIKGYYKGSLLFQN